MKLERSSAVSPMSDSEPRMTRIKSGFLSGLSVVLVWILLAITALAQAERWSEQKARDWYARQPWLVGSNYNPASAINQLEMWQADSFDPKRIDLELGWAESLGMNTMRVYLHDLLWQDPDGFKRRLEQFLTIAAKHKIRPIFVLFDAVWDPDPKLGKQRAPRPGVHNSGWVQSPSRTALQNPAEYPRLEAYVKGVVGRLMRKGAHARLMLSVDLIGQAVSVEVDAADVRPY